MRSATLSAAPRLHRDDWCRSTTTMSRLWPVRTWVAASASLFFSCVSDYLITSNIYDEEIHKCVSISTIGTSLVYLLLLAAYISFNSLLLCVYNIHHMENYWRNTVTRLWQKIKENKREIEIYNWWCDKKLRESSEIESDNIWSIYSCLVVCLHWYERLYEWQLSRIGANSLVDYGYG